MAARFEVPEGLSPPSRTEDTFVDMCEAGEPIPTESEADDPTLFTYGMTACNCVATFNPVTKHRTLCHLRGSDYTGFVDVLEQADILDQNSLVIFSNGHDYTLEDFQVWVSGLWSEMTQRFGAKAGTQVLFYTARAQDETQGLSPGTFAILPDGRYGRIKTPKPPAQTQAETKSRGMPGGGEMTSRGLPGGGDRGLGVKEGGETGKGRFLRMLFCCCFSRGHGGRGARGSKATKKRERKKGGIMRRMVCCCFTREECC